MPEISPTSGNGHDQDVVDLIQRGAQLRTLISDVLHQRAQFFRQAGLTFDGQRDLYTVLGYTPQITTSQYIMRYLRGGVAGRIVDAMPNATWRGTVEILEDRDPHTDTEFEKAWKSIDTRLQVQSKLWRADKLSQLSNYAVLIIGTPDGQLADELPNDSSPDKITYFAAYSGAGGPNTSNVYRGNRVIADDADITIAEYDLDPKSERFGLPKSYQLQRPNLGPTLSFQNQIHWSRCIHIAEGCLFDDVMGLPSLERVWNLLDDLDKVTGGGAEAFWLRANQGLLLSLDKDMQFADPDGTLEKLRAETEAYKHQLTRIMRLRGVEATPLGSDVANFNGPADTILTQIAGAKSIPKRILTGSEMGELASSQDRDNWKDQVNGRQTQYAGPYIVRPLIDRLIKYGYLPKPRKGEMAYEVVWPHIEVLTESEKAEGAQKWATTNAQAGQPIYTAAEIRDHWHKMEPLTDAEIKAEIETKQSAVPIPPAIPGADDKEEDTDEKFPRAAQGENADPPSYSSTEIRLPEKIAEAIEYFGRLIPDDELAPDGREATPHVTIKYGLHTLNPLDVQAVIRDFVGPIHITMGKTFYFDTPEYDVVYVKVESPDLERLHAAISQLPNTSTHPIYVPHATVAYVKSGLGAKYADNEYIDRMTATFDEFVFSPKVGPKTTITLAPNMAALSEVEHELLRIFEAAIACGNDDVINAMLGKPSDEASLNQH